LPHRPFDLLGLVVGDLDIEFFFEFHHEFDDVERVGPDVFNEGGISSDRLLVYSQVLAHDLDNTLLNLGGHGCTLRRWGIPTASPAAGPAPTGRHGTWKTDLYGPRRPSEGRAG